MLPSSMVLAPICSAVCVIKSPVSPPPVPPRLPVVLRKSLISTSAAFDVRVKAEDGWGKMGAGGRGEGEGEGGEKEDWFRCKKKALRY